jgi:hypothetical protein
MSVKDVGRQIDVKEMSGAYQKLVWREAPAADERRASHQEAKPVLQRTFLHQDSHWARQGGAASSGTHVIVSDRP